jgi:hypothetical protein
MHALAVALKFGFGTALVLAGLTLVFCHYACKVLARCLDWAIEHG